MEKILLVLDLDETLIHATTRGDIGREPDFFACDFPVYRRPHLDQFLKMCFCNFHVGVWTSAGHEYAKAIVENTMGSRDLEFLWSQTKCTQRYNTENFQYYWHKNIRKLLRKGFSRERILAVDDSPEKWERSYGNYLRVQPYFGDQADQELALLTDYLPTLKEAPNIRAIEKRNWSHHLSVE